MAETKINPNQIDKPVVTNGDNTGLVVKANMIYKFDYSTPLTTLTITSVEVSDYESIIYFATGNSISFTDNSSLKWGGDGSAPALESNTIYCIAICNGLAEIDTFGTKQTVTFKTFEKQNQAIEEVGNLTIADGVVSGFSANDYLQTSVPFAPGNNSWSIKVPFIVNLFTYNNNLMGSTIDNTDYQGIGIQITNFGELKIYLGSNGYSWDIASAEIITTLSLNTKYYLLIEFDNNTNQYKCSLSTDDINYTLYKTITNQNKIYQSSAGLGIGIAKWSGDYGALNGSIYMNEIDINIKTPLASVNIAINSNTYTTDSDGEAITNLYTGTYPYTANKTGYQETTGNIKIGAEIVSQEILLSAE